MHDRKLPSTSSILCIIALLFCATLPFIPVIAGLFSTPDAAYYNMYLDEDGKRIATPEGDAVLLYGPFLNSARTFSFGTPLIEEHSNEFLNISLVLSMLPFSLMVWIFGLTWGSIFGIIICHFVLLLLMTFIFKKLTNSLPVSTVYAITVFFAFIVFRPFNITTLLRTKDISSFFGVFGDLGYFTRLPSYSFTFLCLVTALLVVYYFYSRADVRNLDIKSPKAIAMLLLIGFCGVIYLYNFIVLFAVLCLVIVLLILSPTKSDNQKRDSRKRLIVLVLSLLVLSLSFLVTFVAKHNAQPDNLLGFATKYGLVSTHGIAKENAGALLVLVISIALLTAWIRFAPSSMTSKSKSKAVLALFSSRTSLLSLSRSPAGFVFICIFATVAAANANVIFGFNVQVFHMVDFLAFFGAVFLLLLLLSFKRQQSIVTSCCIAFMLIVIFSNVFLVRDEFRALDPNVSEILEYIKSNNIEHQTILSSDETITYLLPVYTNNYLFVDNSYFAYVNVTNNLARFAKQSRFLNAPLPVNSSLFSYSLYENMFFHWAYTYLYVNPPCDTCTFNGETRNVGWLDSSFAQVPDHLAEFYHGVLTNSYEEPLTPDDFASVDYVVVSKRLGQQLSFSQLYELVHENEAYVLYERVLDIN